MFSRSRCSVDATDAAVVAAAAGIDSAAVAGAYDFQAVDSFSLRCPLMAFAIRIKEKNNNKNWVNYIELPMCDNEKCLT